LCRENLWVQSGRGYSLRVAAAVFTSKVERQSSNRVFSISPLINVSKLAAQAQTALKTSDRGQVH